MSWLDTPDPPPRDVTLPDGRSVWGDMRRVDVEPRLPSFVAAVGRHPRTQAVITLRENPGIRPGDIVRYEHDDCLVLAVFDPYDRTPSTVQIRDPGDRRRIAGQFARQVGKWTKLLVRKP